jgi:type IV secretory pathway VirB10-like protein
MGKKVNKNGLLGTIIFHSIIAAILLLLGFHTPLPLPEEKGILISFGDTPQGKGIPSAPPKAQKPKPRPKKTVQPKKAQKPKTIAKPKPKPAPKVLTQKHEDAPAIKSGNAKKKREDLKKKREQEKLRKQREAERKKQAEEKRIRQEQERIRKEKEAQIKREEEKKRQEEERKRKFAESMNSKAKNLFGKSKDKSTGNGNTDKAGNQGSKSGSPKGDVSGTGTGNSGISYDLKGRSAEYIHKPKINFTKGGKVVVEVIVDNTGKVVRATPGAIGSTTTNQTLYNIAKKSALKTRFNTSKSAPKHQKGTITYIFIVK